MAILELQSTTLVWVDDVEISTAAAILERIKQRAIAKWGEEKWKANLVREYVKFAKLQDPQKHKDATSVNRRPQIERAFEVGSCTLDTAIILAAAVGCRFQMACTEVTVEEF
jgi:hypothetical protein